MTLRFARGTIDMPQRVLYFGGGIHLDAKKGVRLGMGRNLRSPEVKRAGWSALMSPEKQLSYGALLSVGYGVP